MAYCPAGLISFTRARKLVSKRGNSSHLHRGKYLVGLPAKISWLVIFLLLFLVKRKGAFISEEPRLNDRIRVPQVRLVGPNGEQIGIVKTEEALRMAQEVDLDLVEVAAEARPPVVKIMDFGKFKYEAALKAREARKNQANTVVKEMKLRPRIESHDYDTKLAHIEKFLKAGDKVKVTIMFRGREQSRPEMGYKLLARLAEDVTETGVVEYAPKQDGRNMVMVLAPVSRKSGSQKAKSPQESQEEGE